MPTEDDNLRQAELHVAEAEYLVTEERERIARLRAGGSNTTEAEQTLAAFETNLKIFEENRQLLIEEQTARKANTLAAREAALARLKAPSRVREFGQNLKERLSKFR